jgi:hypothetical protein
MAETALPAELQFLPCRMTVFRLPVTKGSYWQQSQDIRATLRLTFRVDPEDEGSVYPVTPTTLPTFILYNDRRTKLLSTVNHRASLK